VIEYYRTENSDIGDNTVLSIAEDDLENKWMATTFGGLCIVTGDFEFLNFNLTNSDIPDLSVNDVAIDLTQTGVLGMNTTGIVLFDNTTWTIYNIENSELPDDHIMSVLVDQTNRIWAGTESSGVVVFDRELLYATQAQINKLQVNPNPTNGYVTVQGATSGSEIVIYGISGIEMMRISPASANPILDLQLLPAGYYIARISHGSDFAYLQFTIQK
jgi:hypothetical protein